MFAKIVAVTVLVALVGAVEYDHHATSYAAVSHYDAHGDYHHTAAPLAHYQAAPVLLESVHHEEEHYSHPQYQFKYGVHDSHTHDIKEQEETRDGDVVHGHYSLLQPDGRTRIVHYTSDKHNGFQAQVEYSGHAAHPEVHHKAVIAAPVVHKTVLAAPVYKVPAYPHF